MQSTARYNVRGHLSMKKATPGNAYNSGCSYQLHVWSLLAIPCTAVLVSLWWLPRGRRWCCHYSHFRSNSPDRALHTANTLVIMVLVTLEQQSLVHHMLLKFMRVSSVPVLQSHDRVTAVCKVQIKQEIWNGCTPGHMGGLQVILLVSSCNLYIPYSDWLPWVWKECHVTPGCATPVVSLRGTHVCTPHKSAPPNCAAEEKGAITYSTYWTASHDYHMTVTWHCTPQWVWLWMSTVPTISDYCVRESDTQYIMYIIVN